MASEPSVKLMVMTTEDRIREDSVCEGMDECLPVASREMTWREDDGLPTGCGRGMGKGGDDPYQPS